MSNELGEFLRTRRARIAPESVGLPRGARRRVPGLRRDELARLAGVSVEYYTRLEQGRSPNVSDSVIEAIAGALSLNETELDHLRTLVRPTRRARPSPRGANRRPKVRPTVQAMLDQMDRLPAFVLAPTLDVVAWNKLGAALYSLSTEDKRNMARHAFLDPAAQALYPAWDVVAEETVANLRLMASRYPDNTELAGLVGELAVRSQVFRELWATHEVKEKSFGAKALNHPVVGRMDLGYETFPLTGEQDLLLVVYAPEPGSADAEKLSLLASWSLPEPEQGLADSGVRARPADRPED